MLEKKPDKKGGKEANGRWIWKWWLAWQHDGDDKNNNVDNDDDDTDANGKGKEKDPPIFLPQNTTKSKMALGKQK